MAKFTVDTYQCPMASVIYEARSESMMPLEYWSRVNSVVNYRGSKPGEAHLIITKECRDAIASSSTHTIIMEDEGETLETVTWRLVHCESIEGLVGDDQLYYAKFLDGRSIADSALVFNTYTAMADAMTGTMTWANVLDALWDMLPPLALGGAFATPSVPARASEGSNFNFDGVGVWRAICQALEACGCVAVFDQETGNATFVEYDDTQAGLATLYTDNASSMFWDGNCLETKPAPEKLAINFPPLLHNRLTDSSYGKPHIEEVSTGLTGALANTRTAIVDTTFAIWNTDYISNETALENRVTDLTQTINGKARAANSKVTRGYKKWIFDFKPGEEVTCVVFAEHAAKGVYTHVSYYEPFEFDLPAPQIRRYTTAETMQITSEADSDGYYTVTVRRYDFDTEAWVDYYDAYAIEVSGEELEMDSIYTGVHIGIYEDGEAGIRPTAPVFSIKRYCTQRVELFYLITNWYGGVAIASFVSFGEPSYAFAGIVEDPLQIFSDIMKAGDAGYSIMTCDKRHLAIQAKCKQSGTGPSGTVGKCTVPTSRSGGTDACFVTTAAICAATSYPGVGIPGTYHGDGTTCP